MSDAATNSTGETSVLVLVPAGRNAWTKKQVTLHYEANRLIRVDGIELPKAGPMGLTGTLYMVKDLIYRDTRPVMRVERQKIVNGAVVDRRNWGELEETVPRAA